MENKTRQQVRKSSTLEKIEKMHPHSMLLYLAMLGSLIIFSFLLFAYFISKPDQVFENAEFPKAFVFSTMIMLISSFFASRILPNFHEEKIHELRNNVLLTIGFGIIFSLIQFYGWLELESMGIYMSSQASGAYLYVISGLHVVHLLAGLIFLTYLFALVVRTKGDKVDSLLLVTNPYRKIQFEMFTHYWHFLDAIWIIVFIFFMLLF